MIMDRFLVKGVPGGLLGRRETRQAAEGRAELEGEEESSRKRRRREAPGGGVAPTALSWQPVRAESLNCDYTVLFSKAEADEIFRELEKDVEYFTGEQRTVGVGRDLLQVAAGV